MAKFLSPDEMTSRDYYFDSYAHFGIHEVLLYLVLHLQKFSFVGLESLETKPESVTTMVERRL